TSRFCLSFFRAVWHPPALHQLLCTSAHFMCIDKPSAYGYTAAAYGITILCPRFFPNTGNRRHSLWLRICGNIVIRPKPEKPFSLSVLPEIWLFLRKNNFLFYTDWPITQRNIIKRFRFLRGMGKYGPFMSRTVC